MAKKGSVILLHGLMCNKYMMEPLAMPLRSQGYNVLNIDYPSREHDLSVLADLIHPQIEEFLAENPTGNVHFAGHSLGGLLIREYLDRHPLDRNGRVLMLGTPNNGSAMVDRIRDHRVLAPLARRVVGPVGDQLATDHAHPRIKRKNIGVIAGQLRRNPVRWLTGGEESDGLVTVESTRLDGRHHHIILDGAEHITMPLNPSVIKEAVHFLDTGKFSSHTAGAGRA